MKRPFPMTIPQNKRFRSDLNNSFPGTNRNAGPMRNYPLEPYAYDRPVPYNNGNDRWPPRYPMNPPPPQPRQEIFQRTNFELQSLATDTNNNGFYGNRPSHHMSEGNQFNSNQQPRFNNGHQGYDNPQANYDPNFIRPSAQVCLFIDI